MNCASTFDLQRIRDETFIHEIDFHWQLGSTNSHAMQRAAQDPLQTPLLVLTEQQTDGRGRGSNRWWSAPGALTFSVIVPLHDLPGDRLPRISLTVGLAICQAVEPFAPHADLGIKWPNDVYLNQRKLAGILIELPPRRPPHAVIGVGINVNNSLTDNASELIRSATSLADTLECEVDRSHLLIECLQQIERRLDELRHGSTNLTDQWRAYHILQDRTVEIDTYNGRLQGNCLGIDDDGALLLETTHGVRRCLGGVIARFQQR